MIQFDNLKNTKPPKIPNNNNIEWAEPPTPTKSQN
uniref:Uncharacterized protein n=1 Tax=Amphimedon queenslandica TaxID=400682 RepID=A0A1X7VGA2_AMPQE